MVMLAALIVCPACGDDGDDKTSDDPGSNSTVFLQNVDYTLKVDSGGQLFSEEDVSKPLVMDVKGDGVSGSLTLKSVDGTFAGKLTVPVGVADTLTLTGTVSVPAAGGDADYQSIISLEDLMDKCGHLYTAKFNYKWDEPAALADSKAYFGRIRTSARKVTRMLAAIMFGLTRSIAFLCRCRCRRAASRAILLNCAILRSRNGASIMT